MKIANPFRSELSRVPYLVDALDFITATISATFRVQHRDDGTHTAVTATSVTVAADPADGSWTGSVGGSLVPTSATQDLGATIRQSGSSVGDHPWRNLRLSGSITWTPYATSGIGQTGVPVLTRTGLNLAYASGGTFAFTLSSGGNDHTFTLGSGIDGVESNRTIRGGSLSTGGSTSSDFGYYERFRGTPMGEWTAVAYAAGNFTASAGTWTVDSGDVSVYSYTLIGKTMVLAWDIGSTDVSANSVLRLAIPGGFTAAKRTTAIVRQTDAGGASAVGLAQVQTGNAYVELYPTVAGGSWGITAGDNTSTQGELVFEVQ